MGEVLLMIFAGAGAMWFLLMLLYTLTHKKDDE
jgi:hypothetical protein